MDERVADLVRGTFAEDGPAGVTRDDPGEDEHDEDDPEQDRDRQEQPSDDEPGHGGRVGSLWTAPGWRIAERGRQLGAPVRVHDGRCLSWATALALKTLASKRAGAAGGGGLRLPPHRPPKYSNAPELPTRFGNLVSHWRA